MKYILFIIFILFSSVVCAMSPLEISRAIALEQKKHGVEKIPATNKILHAEWGTGTTVSMVGYSPVIVILPQGINMGASAVVSADRRYVRFSTSPTIMFSSIPKVTTYNLSNGNTVTTRNK